ncbi:MAG: ATP synthase F1 subunit delta [Geminocystis sp.]|nr:ATP synthase F1 subunit delta [Geminocystis sp.]HIK37613.1 F0F1 ATP synthase subunit delta [Geminocystis sp. M7585_C2015_104]
MRRSITAEVVEPYAEALMSVAQAHNIVQDIGAQVRELKNIFQQCQDLCQFLASPLIKATDKKEVIRKAFGGQVHPFLLNFLLLLVDRRRIGFAQAIFDEYLGVLRRLNNTVLAEVTAAVTLSDGQREALVNKIRSLTGAQAVELETRVDPSLMGGIIIKIGSQVYDASVRGQLRRLGFALLAT